MYETQTSNIAEPVNPYSLIAPPSEASGPIQPINPSQQPVATEQQPVDQSQPVPGSAEYMNQEAANPPTEPHPLTPHLDNLVNSQHDAKALLNYEGPDHLKTIATERAGENLNNEMAKQKAVSEIQQMAPTDLAKALTEKTTGGSWTKAIIYGILGMENSAQAEAAKLGIGKQTTVLGPDNKPYLIKIAANGTPLEGYDAETGKKLTAEQLVAASSGSAMQGAQTSQTMGFDSKGNTISHTVLKNGNVIWKNQTTGETLKGAPEGYHTGKNQQESMAIQAYQRSLQNDEAKNRANVAKGLAPLYTKDEMEQRAHAIKSQIMGIPSTTYGTPGIPTTAPTETQPQAQPQVSGLSKTLQGKIISSERSTAEQQKLYDESVKNGTPGVLPNGNPVAKPGTSLHESGNALDIDHKKLTSTERRELAQNGYFQPLPNDPNHWEKVTPVVPQKGAGAPNISDIQLQNAQAIANYQAPPLTGSGMGGQNAIIMAKVRELNPDFDGSKFKIAQKTRQDFTTGKQGQAVQSMNVAVDHLDSLAKAATELNNGNLPLFNSIAQQYAKNTGQPAPNNFNALKSIVGSEVAKAVTGGASALGDREEIRREINNSSSPQQLAGVIQKYQQLMAGQLKGLKQTYESAGLQDFDKKLLPRTTQVISSMKESTEPTRSKW